jgi:glycosyltransferase involved in cell wall biosynthesis
MKVFFIGQKGIPNKSGGVEAHVEELSKRLVRLGHEVFVYTRPNYTDKDLKVWQGVNLISLPNLSTKHLDAISATFRAVWDLRRHQVDLIHFHSIGPSSLLPLARLLKPGVPIVATFHTRCYFHQKWGFFARAYLKFGEIMLNLFADKVIAISESLNEYARQTYHNEPVYVPNGVSLPINLPARQIVDEWGLTKEGYIVAVSRLVRHKGLHYLIKAYQGLKTDKKLVIVGAAAYTDDYVQELHQLAAGNPNIIFTGNQSGEALRELYSNAYLFVQPSESEGLSIALLEAMSYARTCLVSDIPENLEAIGKAGFAFKDKDAADLRLKLEFLLGQPSLVAHAGGLARKRVEKHYDWDNIGRDVARVYHRAALGRNLPVMRRFNRLASRFISFF